MTIHSEVLSEITMFDKLSARARNALAKQCQLQHFETGQQIVAQDFQPRNIYFIISGKIKTAYHTASGREVIIWRHSKGDVLGVLSLDDEKYRSAHAIALTPVICLSMTRQQFRKVLLAYPEVSFQLNLYLIQLLKYLSERTIEFGGLGVNSRIHAELLRIAKAEKVNGNVVTINQLPTHAEIANIICSHREAVTREFKELESRGLIKRKSGTLTILDLDKLMETVAISIEKQAMAATSKPL